MGKKVKKDEKPPPDDVFDTLLVESRQAGTVVLMLSSPEEDVQSKACEAIYKFVDKCDENKKQLLDLNAVEHLLALMQSEDKIVRRNAVMAVGVMTAHPDVRKYLRKQEATIPALVNLLAPEEDSVCHEFSALAMSNMATEFSSKAAIFENGGVEPLVRCLLSHDPDVQKNGIEAIALLLMDYQTRTAIRDVDGLAPMLECLKSEYAVIQKLALLALERASQDGENRSALRELEAMSRLIDFVAHPECNDLHVMAVMVLSNLLEDLESLELVKETGGLKRLVAVITDQVPPEEEAKGGKGAPDKGGKGSRQAKKSAKDSATSKNKQGSAAKKQESADSSEPPPGEAIIPTLPDVKMCAAKAIARSARSAENRKILHEQETEKMLIHLLSHESAEVQSSAAQALAIMAENLTSRDSIREWDGLGPLIKMISSENSDVKESATLALANLTTANSNNCTEIQNLNGIEPLINCLADGREEAVANSACVLTNLAQIEVLRADAQNKGVVRALIEPLNSRNTTVQSKTALAVAAYVCDAESRENFRLSDGLTPLVALLRSGNDEVRRNAAWAITVCAVDEPTATEICKLGGMELLQEIQTSSTRKSPFAEAALQKLLDSNLSAKYALTGCLTSTNYIENGFYDVGQLRPGTKFLTVEEYAKQDMNDKRPIIIVNAKPDPTVSQAQSQAELDAKQEASKTSVTGKSSRTGRDSKTIIRKDTFEHKKSPRGSKKTRKQQEREEKQREEELQAQLQREAEAISAAENKPYEAPCDSTLLKFIDEVVDKIQPLPTTREQVKALATFVADKMGGPIERGQLSNFGWELPLSQIKFELKSNVVPLGKIKAGIHVHRALLFKTLADKIAVSCSLMRGEYNRAWNEVLLPEEDCSLEDSLFAYTPTPGAPKFPPKTFIVDLIHEPGNLLPFDTPEAQTYKKI
ncbi:armadillo repeat-containing protein 3-like isoform X3 [Ruditapes philippinarum]|uniref:armadillo repeat-containing protein 3-like isoform X3 n=1 Tax=Ruditapes philippinarum TaxID=129788 RepID=UPI00295AD65F|nr:armadillo repeat-containing protein 3-like isoform X3 [Ruditapes philippinarum]